jgi:hypothetical protein
MKSALLILMVWSILIAQSAYNDREYNFAVSSFKNDSLRFTNRFPAGDAEGVEITVRVPYGTTAKFLIGYQRGSNIDGTVRYKRPWTCFDTFDVSNTAKFVTKASFIVNTASDSDAVGSLDSAQLSPYYTMLRRTLPAFRSQYARFVIQGLAGNSSSAYDVFFTIHQPKYIRSDGGKQPEE